MARFSWDSCILRAVFWLSASNSLAAFTLVTTTYSLARCCRRRRHRCRTTRLLLATCEVLLTGSQRLLKMGGLICPCLNYGPIFSKLRAAVDKLSLQRSKALGLGLKRLPLILELLLPHVKSLLLIMCCLFTGE